MHRTLKWVITPLLLAGFASRASSPCWAPQVTLSPGMNTTAVQGGFTLSGAAATSLRVEAEDGSTVDPADFTAGLASPGWYTVHVKVPLRNLESSDRSLVPGLGEFWAEVLVGRSEPGLARIDRCELSAARRNVVLRWSEKVQFDGEPLAQIELISDAGLPLSCTDRLAAADAGYDGGFLTLLSLDCPDEAITAVRVLRAPRSAAGIAAVFPPEGEAWAATAWAADALAPTSFPRACQVWQPDLRRRTHENVSASGLGPTYAKCDAGAGCTCSSSGSLALLLGALVLARSSRRDAR